jgi:hypothetical protein
VPAPGDCDSSAFLTTGGLAALLPFARSLITDVPGAILLRLRADRARAGGARQRWHSAQWLTVGAGALLIAGVAILVYLHAIIKDPAVLLMTAGALIGALGHGSSGGS